MSKTIIIMGSSRMNGDTADICNTIIEKYGYHYQDLQELVIMPFDYDHENQDDDFLGFMKFIIPKYDNFIFATPVYWYAMSGTMKIFFDRFTDLVTIEKDLGRAMKGKRMKAISVSKKDDCRPAFGEPFELSAAYLEMHFDGYWHFPVDEPLKVEKRLSHLSPSNK